MIKKLQEQQKDFIERLDNSPNKVAKGSFSNETGSNKDSQNKLKKKNSELDNESKIPDLQELTGHLTKQTQNQNEVITMLQ